MEKVSLIFGATDQRNAKKKASPQKGWLGFTGKPRRY